MITLPTFANSPPQLAKIEPPPFQEGVPANFNIEVDVIDEDNDVNPFSIKLFINDVKVHPFIYDIEGGYKCIYPLKYTYQPYRKIKAKIFVSDYNNPPNSINYEWYFTLTSLPEPLVLPINKTGEIEGFDCKYDSKGNLHLVYTCAGQLIHLTNKGGEWYSEVVDPDDVYKPPALAIGPEDYVYVAYFSSDPAWPHLNYSNNTSGEFELKFRFYSWMFPYSKSRPFDIEVDSKKDVHLLWYDEADTESQLYYYKFSQTGANKLRKLDKGFKPCLEPKILLDNLEQPHIFWILKRSNYSKIMYCYRPKGNKKFTDPIFAVDELLTNVRSPTPLSDPFNNIWLFYEDWYNFTTYHKLGVTVKIDENFVEPLKLFNFSENIRLTALSFDNETFIVFPYTSKEIYKIKLNRNGTISEIQTLLYGNFIDVKAVKKKEITGNALLKLLEVRLDNVIFKAGFAK